MGTVLCVTRSSAATRRLNSRIAAAAYGLPDIARHVICCSITQETCVEMRCVG